MSSDVNVRVGRNGGDAAVARIQCGEEVVAELAQGSGSVDVVLHPRGDGQPWRLGCDQLENVLRQAKLRLIRA